MFNDLDQQIDFIMVDVGHALNFRDETTIQTRDIALSRPDTCMKSGWWQDHIVCKVNSHLTDCDSAYEHIRQRSEAIFSQEINLAMHLATHYICVDMPAGQKIDNFAAILNRYLAENTL